MSDDTRDRADEELQRLRRTVRKQERALRDREARLREAQTRLAALEGSTALQVGRRLAAAARKPRRNLVRLPGDLYRLAKGREPGTAVPEVSPPPSIGWPVLRAEVGQDERLLFGASARPRDRLIIAGVLTAEARQAFSAVADVIGFSPHDAGVVVDDVDPDLVIVEAAACTAGGPWAYLGDPAATDKQRSLNAVFDAARARGRPVVLWRNARCAPGLEALAWDAIEDCDLGVPLDRFNPLAADGARGTDPVHLGPLDPRAPLARRRLVDQIIKAVGARVVESADAPLRHAVVVADDPVRVFAALACGARVVSPHDERLAEAVAGHVTFVAGVDEAVAAVAAARAAGPRSAGEVRGVLRTLFTRHATAVRLAGLTACLGLDADPLRDRRVSVLAAPPDARRAAALADELLTQTHRPAEIVLPSAEAALREALGSLPEHGVEVREGPPTAAWAAPWPDHPVPDAYLADLLCAAECTGADAVGPGDGPDYTFVPSVEPRLMRPDLLASEVPPERWAARGARLLALGPALPGA
ncbi:hypothetical protein [Actinomadura sp. HBU206391]|uniref:hypothetical protein n=1 Tax=Actinomadura sp. HBU206391 TaxID=2731692 RepID=UPI00164F4C34|nr:hypothetical protein [Actinomadura sp. HBU206391]MBC6460900.1 hypothetical protein [Actinomadura sp. HBU206391]